MKNIIILLLIPLLVTCTKNQKIGESETSKFGINNQIWNIIDSTYNFHQKESLYISIGFYSENDSNYVTFSSGGVIFTPPGGPPHYEQPFFYGYKERDSQMDLIFYCNPKDSALINKFIVRDSLSKDKERFRVLMERYSDLQRGDPGRFTKAELYYISESDSLIFLREEY